MVHPSIPPEVWSRVLFFVAPALPFVGLEDESFVEDVKQWRGDAKGGWKDVDALMLVSKRMNELASPIFWSYVVLVKPRAASELLSSLLGPGPEHAEERLGWIKVLQLPNVATPLAEPKTTWEKTKHEHPFVTLVRRSPILRHLHLVYGTELASTSIPVLLALAMRDGSLTGLTGLAVDNTNLPAVLLALKPHAPTLRQLSIFHAGGPQPLLYNQLPSNFELEFPRLRYLANGLLHSPGPTTHWLEDMASDDWTFSCLTKIAVGFPPGDVVRPEIVTQNTFLGDDPASSFFVRGLHSAISSFPHVAISEMREFAFRVCTPDDEEEDDQQSEVELRAKLDEAPDGVAAFVESVVLVDAGGTMLPSATRNLVQLVCRTRFPLLKTVVWITRKKDDLATARPAPLLKWIADLTKSGVIFDFQ